MGVVAGYVALVGWPNAGKSTLVNTLVGEKISIVSDKPQTTRRRVTGIMTSDEFQAVLVDAPGIVRDQKGLNQFLAKEYEAIISECDAILVLLNVDERNPHRLFDLLDQYKEVNKPKFALITKSDLNPNRVSSLSAKLHIEGWQFESISSKDKFGVTREKVKNLLKDALPMSQGYLFEKNVFTLETLKSLSSEIIREKCFEYLFQEVPYGLAVQVRKFDESDRLTKIYADVIVEKENHKEMVIGRKASMIRSIGIAARKELEELTQTKVFLDLHVSVKKAWVKNKTMMEELGYVIPS